MRKQKAITLISLVITIVVLIILSSIVIYLSLGNNGIYTRAKEAKELTNKQEATDIINLKITTAQINKYAEKEQMPTLQELADQLYEDNEIEYIALETKVGSKEKITVGNKTSIFTKLKQYPYEFEINSSLQLASINGVKVATANQNTESVNWKLWKKGIGYTSRDKAIQLPEDFNELLIDLELPEQQLNNGTEESTAYSYSWIITKQMIKNYYKCYVSGMGCSDYSIYAIIYINQSNVYLHEFNQYNNDITNKGELSVYYK